MPTFDPNKPFERTRIGVPKFDPNRPFEKRRQTLATVVPEGPSDPEMAKIPGMPAGPHGMPASIERQMQKGPTGTEMTLGQQAGDIALGTARGVIAGTADLPGDIWGMMGEADRFILDWAKKHLPSGVAGAAENVSAAVSKPISAVIPPPAHFRSGISEPTSIPGKVAEVGGALLGATKGIGAVQAIGRRLTRPKPVPSDASRIAGEIEAAGKSPESIQKALRLEDLTQVQDFPKRFPTMAQYGVKNTDEAAKTAGEMYNQVEKMKSGLSASLDITAPMERTGMSFGKSIDEAIQITPPNLLSPAMIKSLRPGKGPFTVGDKLKSLRQLRKMERMTNDVEKGRVYREYINLLKDLKTNPGQDDIAHSMLREADLLYTEAMRAGDVGKAVTEASKLGGKTGVYGKGLVSGKPTVNAVEVLMKLDEGVGMEKARKMLGPDFDNVKKALQDIGNREINKVELEALLKKAGVIGRVLLKFKNFASGFFDWRMVSKFAPSAIGTPQYHIAKALQGAAKK